MTSLVTAEIMFDYGMGQVAFSKVNTSQLVTFIKDGQAYQFKRNFNQEKAYLLKLSELIEFSMDSDQKQEDHQTPDTIVIPSLKTDKDIMDFSLFTIPEIELQGWRVVRKHEAFVELIHDEDVSWYSELDEVSDHDYFDFKMGIIVNEEKINILPLVSEIIATMPVKDFSHLSDDDQLPIQLPDGKLLTVPYSRVKPMLNILIELYDKELPEGDGVKISKRQASLLYEIEKAFQASKLRWFGGDQLRKLGKQLNNFSSIKKS